MQRLETHCRVQSNYGKHENANQGHDNKEVIEPTAMSEWSEPMEKQPRQGKCCYVIND